LCCLIKDLIIILSIAPLEEFRGKPGKNRGKLPPFHFRFMTSGSGDVISGDVISGDATSGDACARDHFRLLPIAPPQMRFELCLYTTPMVRKMLYILRLWPFMNRK
jgi:hypothetical protein